MRCAWMRAHVQCALKNKMSPFWFKSNANSMCIQCGQALSLVYHTFTVAYINVCLAQLLPVSIDCFSNLKTQRCKESDFFDSGQIASSDAFLDR